MSIHHPENRLYARSSRIDKRLTSLSILQFRMQCNGQFSEELDARIRELQSRRDTILRLLGYLD